MHRNQSWHMYPSSQQSDGSHHAHIHNPATSGQQQQQGSSFMQYNIAAPHHSGSISGDPSNNSRLPSNSNPDAEWNYRLHQYNNQQQQQQQQGGNNNNNNNSWQQQHVSPHPYPAPQDPPPPPLSSFSYAQLGGAVPSSSPYYAPPPHQHQQQQQQQASMSSTIDMPRRVQQQQQPHHYRTPAEAPSYGQLHQLQQQPSHTTTIGASSGYFHHSASGRGRQQHQDREAPPYNPFPSTLPSHGPSSSAFRNPQEQHAMYTAVMAPPPPPPLVTDMEHNRSISSLHGGNWLQQQSPSSSSSFSGNASGAKSEFSLSVHPIDGNHTAPVDHRYLPVNAGFTTSSVSHHPRSGPRGGGGGGSGHPHLHPRQHIPGPFEANFQPPDVYSTATSGSIRENIIHSSQHMQQQQQDARLPPQQYNQHQPQPLPVRAPTHNTVLPPQQLNIDDNDNTNSLPGSPSPHYSHTTTTRSHQSWGGADSQEKWNRHWQAEKNRLLRLSVPIPDDVVVVDTLEECRTLCDRILSAVNRVAEEAALDVEGDENRERSNGAEERHSRASMHVEGSSNISPAASANDAALPPPPNRCAPTAATTHAPISSSTATPPHETTSLLSQSSNNDLLGMSMSTCTTAMVTAEDSPFVHVFTPLQPQATTPSSPSKICCIALDLEGEDLGARGTITVVTIGTPSKVYIVDVAKPGNETFFQEGGLAEVLANTRLYKLVFDCRADADALRQLHNISLVNVCDLQVMATMATSPRGQFLAGMQKVFTRLYIFSDDTRNVRQSAVTLFDPTCGGSYAIWKLRPFPATIIDYCAVNVKHYFLALHMLLKYFHIGCTVGNQRLEVVRTGAYTKTRHNSHRDFDVGNSAVPL